MEKKDTTVVIEVRGGVAEVTHEPEGVEVIIWDWDNNDAGEEQDMSDELRALLGLD